MINLSYNTACVDGGANMYSWSENEPFICLFSGGKDAGLALSLACQYGMSVALVYIIEGGTCVFNYYNKIEMIKEQARLLNIPLVFCNNHDNPYVYCRNMAQALHAYTQRGIHHIVLGTINDNVSYQFNKKVFESLNFDLVMPLYAKDYEWIMSGFENFNIESIITNVCHPALDIN